jgi:hypothetical protein
MKKTMSLILLVLCLLQPLACYACPCDSSLGSPDVVDTSGQADSHSHNHDSDNCDSTVCCAVCLHQFNDTLVNYTPSVSVTIPPEKYQHLPDVVMPIFIPPQNLA